MGKFEYGYWAIRGLGAPGRMLLAYGNADVNEHQYQSKVDANGKNLTDPWFGEDKPTLQKENPLINLPYVRTPSGSLVTQSNAVYTTIAREIGLAPKTPGEEEMAAQLLAEAMDLRNNAFSVFYGKPQPPEEYLESARNGSFKKLENWFALKGTKFATGAEPRACDFLIFEMIDQHIKIFGVMPTLAKAQGLPFKLGEQVPASAKPVLPKDTAELFAAYDAAAETVFPMARFPHLRAFHQHFRAQPQLKKYFDSDSYRLACNGGPAAYDNMEPLRA